MQLMDQLYERHAVACVWLIKYLTENVSSILSIPINDLDENCGGASD